MEKKPLFYEKQQFRQPWLWILMVVVFASVVFAGYIADKKSGNAGIIIIIVTILPLLLGMFLLWKLALITKIDDTGIHVKFQYFHKKFRHYKWENIESLQIKKYNPVGDYGGWGIRLGAYNVSGNHGLLIRFKDGATLLIGTNKSVELKKALESAGRI